MVVLFISSDSVIVAKVGKITVVAGDTVKYDGTYVTLITFQHSVYIYMYI